MRFLWLLVFLVSCSAIPIPHTQKLMTSLIEMVRKSGSSEKISIFLKSPGTSILPVEGLNFESNRGLYFDGKTIRTESSGIKVYGISFSEEMLNFSIQNSENPYVSYRASVSSSVIQRAIEKNESLLFAQIDGFFLSEDFFKLKEQWSKMSMGEVLDSMRDDRGLFIILRSENNAYLGNFLLKGRQMLNFEWVGGPPPDVKEVSLKPLGMELVENSLKIRVGFQFGSFLGNYQVGITKEDLERAILLGKSLTIKAQREGQ